MILVFPQSHKQSQRLLFFILAASEITVKRPNLRPSKSIFFIFISIFR